MIAVCPYCEQPIDLTGSDVMQRVVGWERKAGIRASGKHGGSDVYRRERRQRWAHGTCVKNDRRGISAKQQSLLDLVDAW